MSWLRPWRRSSRQRPCPSSTGPWTSSSPRQSGNDHDRTWTTCRWTWARSSRTPHAWSAWIATCATWSVASWCPWCSPWESRSPASPNHSLGNRPLIIKITHYKTFIITIISSSYILDYYIIIRQLALFSNTPMRHPTGGFSHFWLRRKCHFRHVE